MSISFDLLINLVRTMRHLSLLILLVFISWPAQSTVIDNSAWTGNTNSGWAQSAQTLSFGTNTTLNSFGWWLGQSHTHQVSVVEWNSGPGSVLFSTTQAWSAGFNQINPNVVLNAGTLYAVLFNYLGSTTSTVHYNSTNGYAGGEWWLLSSSWNPWSGGNDIRFIANVDEGQGGNVPEPATLLLMGLGLAGLTFRRKESR